MASKLREAVKGSRRGRGERTAALLAAAFENAAAGLCLIGADGTVLRANPALLRLAGLGAGDVEGHSAEPVLEALGLGRLVLERAQAGEPVVVAPRRALGHTAELWWSGRLVPTGEAVLLWAEDVTARASAERESAQAADALRRRAERAEALLETLAATVPGAVVVVDSRGELTLANPAAGAMFGISPGDRYGLSGAVTLHRPDGEPLPFEELPLARAVEQGEPSRGVEVVVRARDWQMTLAVHAAPARGADGAVVGAVALFEDPGRRQPGEGELEAVVEQAAANAALLDALIESVSEGIVLYGPSGEIVRMNGAAERVLGFSDSERRLPPWARIGMVRVETPEGEPFPADRTPAARALRGESVRGSLMLVATAAGGRLWVSASAAPVFGEDGAVLGAVSVFEDVSRGRALESQRDWLLQALATGLRRPLLALCEQAGRIASAEAIEQVGELVGPLVAGTSRASRQLDSLIDRARLEKGELKVNLQPLELPAFMGEIGLRLSGALGESVRLRVPPDLPRIAADPLHLERVLVELLARVAEGSSARGELSVRLQRRDGEASFLVLRESADLGAGERSGSVLREPEPGVPDAALEVAVRLVELHGGRIVQLGPGRDAGFLVLLPSLEEPQLRWEDVPGGEQPWQD